MISIGLWINWYLLDSTDSNSSFNGSNLDVSLISPCCSPWVSNNIVVLSWGWISSITYSGNSMVKSGSASSRVQNTWFVLLEYSGVSFNSNCDWLFSNSSLKLSSRVGWNSWEWAYFYLSSILRFLASLGQCSVNVIIFKFLCVKLSMSEGIFLPSSVTSSW